MTTFKTKHEFRAVIFPDNDKTKPGKVLATHTAKVVDVALDMFMEMAMGQDPRQALDAFVSVAMKLEQGRGEDLSDWETWMVQDCPIQWDSQPDDPEWDGVTGICTVFIRPPDDLNLDIE